MENGILEEIEASREPFPYFIAGKALDAAEVLVLTGWLESEAPWHLHQGGFYEQYECDMLATPLPEGCAGLFREEALEALRRRVEVLLGAELSRRTRIIAHRLTVGQGIGLHNDDPDDQPEEGLETHRLIVQLNRSFEDRQGGHLVFFDGSTPDRVHRVFRPIHNTAVGFAMSSRSYHAVSDVREGARYTLVYSFWQLGRPGAEGEER